MPLTSYGVLKGNIVDIRQAIGSNPHYQIRIIDDTEDYRIAVNVKSSVSPSEVEYLIVENFSHPITAKVSSLPLGFTPLQSTPTSGALDYIRGNLFDRSAMKPLAYSIPGVDNDLNEKLHGVVQRAMADESSVVYAFGQRWGPEPAKKDRYFGFLPGNGIHDIHMNQSNVTPFIDDDGVWQDGGLLIEFPRHSLWVAVFLKFQSQGWHTDDATGHKIGGMVPFAAVPPGAIPIVGGLAGPVYYPTSDEPQGMIRIVAALVNSVSSPEVEYVTIVNTTPGDLDLTGWHLLDQRENRMPLEGMLPPGETLRIKITSPVQLSNKGGLITIVDGNDLKIDGVAYTQTQASHPGWTITF